MASIAAVAMIADVSSLLNTQQSLNTARASVLLVCGLSLLALPFSVFNQLRLGRMQANRVAPALIAGNLCGFFAALAASRLTDSPLAFIASAAWPPVLSQIFVAIRTRVSEARLPSRCTNAPLVRANRRVRLDASPFFVTQLATLGSFHVDNLIISAMLSSSQAAEYSLTNRYFSIISILLSVYLATAWPQYAKLQHLNDRAALHRVFWRNVIGSVVAAVVCSVVLIAVSSPFFRTWTRASVLPDSGLMLAMAAFAIVNAALGNVSVLLSSMGSVRIQAVVSTALLLPNVGLSIVLVREVGVAGPVIASALCASLMLTTYLLYWKRARRGQRS
jgi:O-antigen/teichoic acid export membrane protein